MRNKPKSDCQTKQVTKLWDNRVFLQIEGPAMLQEDIERPRQYK